MKRAVFVSRFTAFMTLLLSLTAGGAMAQGKLPQWSVPRNISDTPGSSRFPRAASDMEGNLHVVWSENVDTAPGGWGNAIYYTQYRNGRWSKPVDIVYNGSSIAMLPGIAVDAGYVHIIWTDKSHLYHQSAPIETATNAIAWSSRRVISWDGQESAYWSDIKIAGNSVHVVWSGSPGGLWDIAYARSSDGGRTWTEPVRVTDTQSVMETRPRLAVDSRGALYLMWGQNAENDDPIGPMMFSRSPNGTQWDLPVRATPFDGFSDLVSLLTDDKGRLHQIWQQGGEWHSTVQDPNHGLYHRWSEDGGKTWTKPTRIARGWSYLSSVVDSASRLHLVWSEQSRATSFSLEDQDLFYAFWDGHDWSAPLSIQSKQGDMRPELAVTGGNKIHAVWAKGRAYEGADVFYASISTDAPEIRPLAYPTLTPAPASLTPSPTPRLVSGATAIPQPTASLGSLPLEGNVDPSQTAWTSMVLGIIPVLGLVLVFAGSRLWRRW